MSMHLCNPGLTTTGKQRAKKKFKSAADAQLARQLDADWATLQRKWSNMSPVKSKSQSQSSDALVYKLAAPAGRGDTKHIPSLNSGAQVAALQPSKVYTGNAVVGIATLHKSNAVPVFSNEEAIEISKMRRG